jgi:hypothetical protein
MVVDAALQAPGSSQQSTIHLDLQLTDVYEGQDISAPDNAKPFDELLRKLDGLGLGSASAGAGSASGGASADNLQKYSECIQKAGNDADKARKCADLLTP